MPNSLTRRTYFRETISFDEQPSKEEMKQLMDEGFRLDRKNLLWERSCSTSGRHSDAELAGLLNVAPEEQPSKDAA